MKKVVNHSLKPGFPKRLIASTHISRSALLRVGAIGVLSSFSLLSGVAPHLAQRPDALLSDAVAFAQTDPSVTSYANAAYQIERLRQQKFKKVKEQFPDGNVPANVCQQQDIPASVRTICDEFMKESSDIIKNSGLTIAQFNDITRRKTSDTALQQQIDTELLRIQKKTP